MLYIYIHIYIHAYIYMHIYIHTYIFVFVFFRRGTAYQGLQETAADYTSRWLPCVIRLTDSQTHPVTVNCVCIYCVCIRLDLILLIPHWGDCWRRTWLLNRFCWPSLIITGSPSKSVSPQCNDVIWLWERSDLMEFNAEKKGIFHVTETRTRKGEFCPK